MSFCGSLIPLNNRVLCNLFLFYFITDACLPSDHRIETARVHATDYFLNLKEINIEADNTEGQQLSC